jgi:hypothetical protein
VEGAVAPQAVLPAEITDIDVESMPLDEPPEQEGDDGAAHGATNGAVDEGRAVQEEAAEQDALGPADLEPREDEEVAVGVNIQKFRAASSGRRFSARSTSRKFIARWGRAAGKGSRVVAGRTWDASRCTRIALPTSPGACGTPLADRMPVLMSSTGSSGEPGTPER